jgi:hypothetical protein
MDAKEKDVLRDAMEVQFRYMFYKRPEFPFLPSMGVKDIFQAFGNDEVGFIGFLHLKHTHRGEGEKEWDSIWYDTPDEGAEVQERWFEDVPYDRHKLLQIHIEHFRDQARKERKQKEKSQLEELEEDEDILLN